MSQEQKHTLFYSNHCGHSKDAMTLIASRGVRDRFVLICVEQYASALPRFVDCVPLLYTSNAEILTDEDLLLFLQNIRPNNTNKAAMVADVVDPTASELSAFDLSSSGGSAGLSDSFSFIDSSNEQQHQKPRGYIYISSPPTGDADAAPSPAPAPLPRNVNSGFPKPVETRRQTGDFSSDLDRFKATRDNEISGLQSAPRVF